MSVSRTFMVCLTSFSLNSLMTSVLFWPAFLAFCTEMNLFPSCLTIAVTSRPSAVVSSNSLSRVNFNSMDFRVVEVLMVHTPLSSLTYSNDRTTKWVESLYFLGKNCFYCQSVIFGSLCIVFSIFSWFSKYGFFENQEKTTKKTISKTMKKTMKRLPKNSNFQLLSLATFKHRVVKTWTRAIAMTSVLSKWQTGKLKSNNSSP